MRWIGLACLAVLLVGCDSSTGSPSAAPSSAEPASSEIGEGDDVATGDSPGDEVVNGPIVNADPAPLPPTDWCPDCSWDRPRDQVGKMALYLREAGTNRSGSAWLDGIAVVGPRGTTTISCPRDFPCLAGGSAPRAEDLAQVDWQFRGWGPVILGPAVGEISMSSLRHRIDVRSFDGEVLRSVGLRGLGGDESIVDLAWSPDRSRLAVATNLARVWIYDADGRRGEVAYTSHATSGPRYLGDLAWSPTGDAVSVVESYEFNGSVYLVVVGLGPRKARQVYWWPSLDTTEEDVTYVWSPDSRRIAVDDGHRLLELSVEDGRVLGHHQRLSNPVWLPRSS